MRPCVVEQKRVQQENNRENRKKRVGSATLRQESHSAAGHQLTAVAEGSASGPESTRSPSSPLLLLPR